MSVEDTEKAMGLLAELSRRMREKIFHRRERRERDARRQRHGDSGDPETR